jgi:hypothetical protein
VFTVGGGEVQSREEDDELLRAAEELGIDISPGSLRATPREPEAQELEEGAPAEEADIEVPADEILNDVDDIPVDELLGADAPEIQA